MISVQELSLALDEHQEQLELSDLSTGQLVYVEHNRDGSCNTTLIDATQLELSNLGLAAGRGMISGIASGAGKVLGNAPQSIGSGLRKVGRFASKLPGGKKLRGLAGKAGIGLTGFGGGVVGAGALVGAAGANRLRSSNSRARAHQEKYGLSLSLNEVKDPSKNPLLADAISRSSKK